MESDRHDFDLLNELPHIYELEDMMKFCKQHKSLYIYGRGWNQEHLLKYFDECNISIDGFVVTQKDESCDNNFVYRKIPVIEFSEMIKMKDVGVILGLSDKYYNEIIPMFRKFGFDDYFMMTEYSKRAIAGQMRKRSKEVLGFEVSMADHCNLSCQMCDHFSQLSEENYVGVDVFEKDMVQMAKLYDHECGPITLLGGEPTLNRDLPRCIEITRREFPKAVIGIMSNGILLSDDSNAFCKKIWESCSKNNVRIEITVYPISINYNNIEKLAKKYDVDLIMSSNIHAEELTKVTKISDKHTLDLNKKVDDFYFINCLYFNKFNVLKNGRIYMCPIEAHIDIFNRRFNKDLTYQDGDSLDICELNSWEEIREWTSHRIPFCSYCDLKKWGHHSEWKSSTKQIEEYI